MPLLAGLPRRASARPASRTPSTGATCWFLTKPIFWLLEFFYRTSATSASPSCCSRWSIRLITFPLANSGYEMSVKMKKIQPELTGASRRRTRTIPKQQQKEMMALYQREKVNPVSGCLPVLLQIPVFYSLTKLFTVTIEMRHAPFFGWIHDLSAPRPDDHLEPVRPDPVGSLGRAAGRRHPGRHAAHRRLAAALRAFDVLTQALSPQRGSTPPSRRSSS